MIELSSLWSRVLGVFLLLCILAVLFVGAGAFEATPSYPGNEAVVDEYDDHVGEDVQIDGVVVSTDPLVLEVDSNGGTVDVTARGVDETVALGDRVVVFGTLESDRTIETHEAIVREPWEIQYMYAISLVGGFWVLGRFLNGWRFDRNALTFIPRTQPLIAGFRGGDTDG